MVRRSRNRRASCVDAWRGTSRSLSNALTLSLSQLSHPLQRRSGGQVWVVNVGIQLDGDPALVTGVADGPEGCGEINGAFAGNQVMMDPRRRDVLQMIVARV